MSVYGREAKGECHIEVSFPGIETGGVVATAKVATPSGGGFGGFDD